MILRRILLIVFAFAALANSTFASHHLVRDHPVTEAVPPLLKPGGELKVPLILRQEESFSRSFVTVKGHGLYRDNAPYYFVGANYWYGGLLGLERDKKRGVERLRRGLDFLKAQGVTNLRLMAGAEGQGCSTA